MKALELFLISFAALCSANDLSNSWSYSTCSSSESQSTKISFNCTLCWEAGYEVELGAKITVIPSDPTATHEFKTDDVEIDRSKKNIDVNVKRVDQHKGWTRMPITVIVEESGKVTCSDPPMPTDGYFKPVAPGIYSVGDIFTYICDTAHEIQGPTKNECLATGQWKNAAATCLNSLTSCSPAPIQLTNGLAPSYDQTGITTPDGFVYRSGTVATYTCFSGFSFPSTTSATVTCTSGTWSPSAAPQCLRDCSNQPPTNAGVSFNNMKRLYTSGDAVTYTCTDLDASLFPPGASNTCQNGAWTSTSPNCIVLM